MSTLLTTRTCHFSPCRLYRYELRIIWDPSIKPKMFIGLNPSTADEYQDDPTIRRCIDFAQRWGCGGLVMTNAFAYRATDRNVMLKHPEPWGEENTVAYLESVAAECAGKPIAAWGTYADIREGHRGSTLGRGETLKRFMGPLDCLRLTKGGHPEHPLYLPKALEPIPFNYAATEGCNAD